MCGCSTIKLQIGKDNQQTKAGSVNLNGVQAGSGSQNDGGNTKISGGDGFNGASGGDVNMRPEIYKAGDGGNGGKGGNLEIKGGNAY